MYITGPLYACNIVISWFDMYVTNMDQIAKYNRVPVNMHHYKNGTRNEKWKNTDSGPVLRGKKSYKPLSHTQYTYSTTRAAKMLAESAVKSNYENSMSWLCCKYGYFDENILNLWPGDACMCQFG